MLAVVCCAALLVSSLHSNDLDFTAAGECPSSDVDLNETSLLCALRNANAFARLDTEEVDIQSEGCSVDVRLICRHTEVSFTAFTLPLNETVKCKEDDTHTHPWYAQITRDASCTARTTIVDNSEYKKRALLSHVSHATLYMNATTTLTFSVDNYVNANLSLQNGVAQDCHVLGGDLQWAGVGDKRDLSVQCVSNGSKELCFNVVANKDFVQPECVALTVLPPNETISFSVDDAHLFANATFDLQLNYSNKEVTILEHDTQDCAVKRQPTLRPAQGETAAMTFSLTCPTPGTKSVCFNVSGADKHAFEAAPCYLFAVAPPAPPKPSSTPLGTAKGSSASFDFVPPLIAMGLLMLCCSAGIVFVASKFVVAKADPQQSSYQSMQRFAESSVVSSEQVAERLDSPMHEPRDAFSEEGLGSTLLSNGSDGSLEQLGVALGGRETPSDHLCSSLKSKGSVNGRLKKTVSINISPRHYGAPPLAQAAKNSLTASLNGSQNFRSPLRDVKRGAPKLTPPPTLLKPARVRNSSLDGSVNSLQRFSA